MKYLKVLVLLIMTCFFSCNKKVMVSSEDQIQTDCSVLDKEFKLIKSFPGDYCAFFPNGEWISITGEVVDLHSKTNQLRKHLSEVGHHEIKLSRNEKKIFFLSYETKVYQGKNTKFDIINISDRDGVIIAHWNLSEHLDEVLKIHNLKSLPEDNYGLNAIYEIPKNNLEKIYPYMKEGNLLVTFNGLGSVIVFDPELRKIEFNYQVSKTKPFQVSDGQILSSGHLLIYQPGKDSESLINELDMQQDKSIWTFVFNQPEFTNNKYLRAVQKLTNNNIFFTDYSNNIGRMIEINSEGEIVNRQTNILIDSRTKKPSYLYRAKKLNLDRFLENNF